MKDEDRVERIHRCQLPLEELREGDTLRGTMLQAYRVVGNGYMSADEAFRTLQRVAPGTFVDSFRRIIALNLSAEKLQECATYNRYWPYGDGAVVGIDLTTRTATIIVCAKDGFTLRTRRFPYVRKEAAVSTAMVENAAD